jgi:hypothetical protein
MTDRMASKTTGALLVAMKDFHPDWEAETNIWLDYDHIPERLSCEGFQWCERLERHPLPPAGWDASQQCLKYLTLYGLASLETLQSPAYKLQKKINAGSGSLMRQLRNARRKASGSGKDGSLRSIWVPRAMPSAAPRKLTYPAPRICLVQFRHDLGEMDGPVNDLVDRHLVPELLMLPGFLGCERYQAGVDDLDAHSEPPHRHPRYMDIFDVSTPEILVTGAYRRYLNSLDSLGPDIRQAWWPAASGIYSQRPSPWRVRIAPEPSAPPTHQTEG